MLFRSVLVVSVSAQDTINKRVKAKLVKPISIEQQTNGAEATVSEINQTGVQVGLNNMRLVGRNSFSKKETGDTGVSIDWHSITLNSGSDSVTEPLSKPLSSIFSTSDTTVETGQPVTVFGNWDELLKDLSDLKKKQSEQVTKVESVDDEEEDSESSGMQPVGPSTTSVAPASDSGYSDMNTDVMTTTYSDCPPFFNEGADRVEEQKKKLTTGESGTVYEDGLCTSTGVFYPILTKDGDCTYQWELETNVATKMVQRYYEPNGEPFDIGDCWASNSTYPIGESGEGCEVLVDTPNMRVMPQTRLRVMVGENPIYYNECTPQGSTEWPLLAENCTDPGTGDQRYEHDTTNHFSYPLERLYYPDPADETANIYVNDCSRSTTVSYEHKYTTDGCGWVMDDPALNGQQFSSTFIEAPDGDLEIESCAARSAPVAYAYVGLTDVKTEVFEPYNMGGAPLDKNARPTKTVDEVRGLPVTLDYVVPEDITKLKIELIGGGYTGGINPLNTNMQGGNGGLSDGGRAGQLVTRPSETVVPGEVIKVTPGLFAKMYVNGWNNYFVGPPTDTIVVGSFGTLTALAGNGFLSSNPNGADGLDSSKTIAQRGKKSYAGTITYYSGGLGFGAGGGGNAAGFGINYGYGAGAYGAAIFTHQVMRYLRPDGSFHNLPYNGD